MDYKRLGDYIRPVDVRNRDLKVTEPMGININKYFMPSVANVIGTDLSAYKRVSKNQFACNLMHVGRDEKIPMAMQTDDNSIIVSPAYFVFEITKTEALLPEYLMMWFRRPEFDRNAWFHTAGDVRGGLDKDEFMDMTLPIPSIERQREIVAEYETLTKRIGLNEQIIQRLEATAQALYRKTFVDNIDRENLPAGFRRYTVGEFLPVVTGKKDANIATDNGKYVFFTCSQDILKTDDYSFDGAAILLSGNGDFNVKYYRGKFEAYQRTYVLMPRNDVMLGLLYNVVKFEISRIGNEARGSVIQFLTKEMVENIGFYAPDNLDSCEWINEFNRICDYVTKIKDENIKLTELQSLLLARMGK